ncbi:Hcp protein [Burkholderia sp. 8Y]|uniref:type VI secretion system tube protein TssD n=1 Tax=Burkholderia sp. 8Y TaxID=2653133 RepID=UPI0012F2A47D|nr:type VI secretion system tube protein TssD [Burkholderia sp. 8Y]VXC89174.1 Hcp protein [Burkholderia sp. 8Y]
MVMPVHLFIEDDQGNALCGSCTVADRICSIEVITLSHGLTLPIDRATGKVTGHRSHMPFVIERAIDRATPLLHQTFIDARTVQSVGARSYHMTNAGKEEPCYSIPLTGVKIAATSPLVANNNESNRRHYDHTELVELCYEGITWHFDDSILKVSNSLDRVREARA